MNIVFKLAEEKDLKRILEIYKSAIKEMEKNGIFQWDEIYPDFQIIKSDIENRQMYLGFINSEIVCAYVLNTYCDEEYKDGNWEDKSADFIIVHRLCVNPIFQNKGIGYLTMKYIEKIVRNKNIPYIRLDSFTLNSHAVRMYEKLEYKKVGYADFRKGKFYLMEKKI